MIIRQARMLKAGRMLSTFVGQNGRKYRLQKVLQRHPKKPELSVCLALSGNKPYVLKPVSPSIFEHLLRFKADFEDHPRLRLHIDQIERENMFVYEYFKTDLLALVENYPVLPIAARKVILKEVALALREMHMKNWIHLDLKPDNVFLNWHVDSKDNFHLEKLTLGDLDCALKLKGDKLLNHRIGNVMWRSPEGQLGKGVGMPSEMFSYALLCIFVITGVQFFHVDVEGLEAEPEQVALLKLLSAFGPLPDALMQHMHDEEAGELLASMEELVRENGLRKSFGEWPEDEFPNLDNDAKSLVLLMTHLDPAKRASISDILKSPYWEGVIGPPSTYGP